MNTSGTDVTSTSEKSAMSLDDIRAREQAATEGPWLRDSSSDKGGANFAENVVAHMWDVARCSGGFTHPDNGREEQAAADADFIAHARIDIPKLLAALDAVLAQAEEWRYKGEFGWGAWQEGYGPDLEGATLDDAAHKIRATITEALR